MTIEYTKIGDYYFPNIKVNQESKIELSKYGRMKLKYMKEHQRVLYTNLLTKGELYRYLALVDKEANDLFDTLLIEFKKQRKITEELKDRNQMLWVQEMNNIGNCTDEIVRKEVLEM